MKNITIGLLALSMLLFNVIAVPTYAQGTQDDPSGQEIQNGAGTFNTTDTQASAADDNDNNWMWLLPLIAVPIIIYLMTRKRDTRDDNRGENARVAGVKGGRSGDDRNDVY